MFSKFQSFQLVKGASSTKIRKKESFQEGDASISKMFSFSGEPIFRPAKAEHSPFSMMEQRSSDPTVSREEEEGPASTSDISPGCSTPTTPTTAAAFDVSDSFVSARSSESLSLGPHQGSITYEDAEELFLEEHEGYFLHLSVDNTRRDQYPKLEAQMITYLDYATCPLYSQSQVEQHMQFLLEQDSHPFQGSPKNTTSKLGARRNGHVDNTSAHILNLLKTNQNEYSVVFSSSISSCYRLFGEMFRFAKGSHVLSTRDHAEFIRHLVCGTNNVKMSSIPLKSPRELCIHATEFHKLIRKRGWSGHGCGLLAYPAQSFFSGMCHSLNWIAGAQQNGWKVLLDVSSCLPMISVDLSIYQPEFVVGSLYHMFGYPSPAAFLLVRRSSHSVCAGADGSNSRLCIREVPERGRSIHVAAESESLNSHTFAAFLFGLQHLEDIGVLAIQRRIQSLISWLLNSLKSLRHKLGDKHLVQLYGSLDPKQRGSILAFNVVDYTGTVLPAGLVQRLASGYDIFLGTTVLDIQAGAEDSFAPSTVAVRLSLGAVSTFSDVWRLVQFLCLFRDESFLLPEAASYIQGINGEQQ